MKLLAAVLVGLVRGQSPMDLGCMLQNCKVVALKAFVNPTFIKNSICETGCTKVYDTDMTPEKLEYQNCTTSCAVSYESDAGNDFLACMMNNNCVSFPPIPGSCPYKKEHIQPGTNLKSLAGEFWQHRGKNALWDCYDCQHIHSMFESNDTEFCAQTIFPETGPVKAPCWSYTYSYDLYLVDKVGGGTRTFQQTWQLPGDVPDGNPIDIYYIYMGSWHNETWYILEESDNYTILGDCSYMMDWIDVGSILWVRPGHVLTDAENAQIKSVYKDKMGWEYETFCHDKHEGTCRLEPGKEVKKGRPQVFRSLSFEQLTSAQNYIQMADMATV